VEGPRGQRPSESSSKGLGEKMRYTPCRIFEALRIDLRGPGGVVTKSGSSDTGKGECCRIETTYIDKCDHFDTLDCRADHFELRLSLNINSPWARSLLRLSLNINGS
jgi:hypothetical protein